MTEVVRVGRAGLGRLSDDEVRALVEDFLVPRLVQEPVAPIAGTLLEGIVDEQTHHGLVDLGLGQLREWLAENPGTYAAVMGERAPWWSPPWVDDKVIALDLPAGARVGRATSTTTPTTPPGRRSTTCSSGSRPTSSTTPRSWPARSRSRSAC